MAEPFDWDVWVKLRWLKHIRHKRGLLVVLDALTSDETSVGSCKLEEVIKKPCSDLLVIHHRKCIHGRIEIF
jgi:hypothetical protein